MNSINGRIYALRKSLQLTQSDFAAKIGLKAGAVGKMEKDGGVITDRNLQAICQAFNVSEHWLRDGLGEMMVAEQPDPLEDVRERYHLTATEEKILRVYVQLDNERRQAITDFIEQIAGELQKNEPSIDDKVEAYRQELLAQAKARSAYKTTSESTFTGKNA